LTAVDAAATGVTSPAYPARWFAELAIGTLVFLGAFVLFEPAPYELLLVLLIVCWSVLGLRISRYILPLTLLLVLYCIGGLIGLTLVEGWIDPIIYIGTTILLAASAVFFASVVTVDPERRFHVIAKAYVAAAVLASLIAILGYAGVLPGSELFTLYDRARGTFQDPNVLGPFLVLPLGYLVYTIFTARLGDSWWRVAAAGVLLVALFLTFSRAAWGMGALVLITVAVIAFVNQRNIVARARVLTYVALGIVLLIVMLGVALTLPATSSLFAERAQLVQYYDAGEAGRFARHAQGFMFAFERPLGVGPFRFGEIFGEDEHNMWLKGFMVYGWLGGFAYIALAIWTVVISLPLVFKRRPWQPLVIAAFATFLGHLVIHNVIDNDHWRHLFLIYGILWGAYAVERLGRLRATNGAADLPPVYRATLPRSASA